MRFSIYRRFTIISFHFCSRIVLPVLLTVKYANCIHDIALGDITVLTIIINIENRSKAAI